MIELQNAIPLIHVIHQLYALYKLIAVCPWSDLGGRESFNSHGAGTFVYPFNYRPRNRHRNLWDRQCVSSWWLLGWFGYLHKLYIDIWFTFKSLTDVWWLLVYLWFTTILFCNLMYLSQYVFMLNKILSESESESESDVVCHLYSFVLTDDDGLWQPALSGHWLSYTGCCQNKYEMSNVWATVFTIVHLPRMFPPTGFLFEKRIGLVTMDLLYIIFTY